MNLGSRESDPECMDVLLLRSECNFQSEIKLGGETGNLGQQIKSCHASSFDVEDPYLNVANHIIIG